jgi:hypothetical protein
MKHCPFPRVWFVRSLLAFTAMPLIATSVVAADSTSSTQSPAMPNVSGTVQFGAQKAPMKHLYFRRKTTDDGEVLALLFSSEPLPAKALDDRQRLTQLSRKRAFLGLYVEVDDTGAVQQTDLLYDDGAFSGPWRFEFPEGKETTTAGRIATEGEREFFGKPYTVDVSYKLNGAANGSWSGSAYFETKPTGLPLGRAEGSMERLSVKTEYPHAVGLMETDLFGDAGERSVLLTTKPVPEEMLSAPTGPEQALHKAGIAFLRVRIDANNEIQSIIAPTDEGHATTFTSNQWTLELARKSSSEIDGYMESGTDNDGSSEYPRFKLKFHAPLKTVGPAAPVTAENGKPLPKGGGVQGQVYRDFAKALMKATTVEELLPLRSSSMAARLDTIPASERTAMLGFLKAQVGTPLDVVGGFANDTQATLWVAGKQDGEPVVGRVNVHREDGVWKLGAESFRMGTLAEK